MIGCWDSEDRGSEKRRINKREVRDKDNSGKKAITKNGQQYEKNSEREKWNIEKKRIERMEEKKNRLKKWRKEREKYKNRGERGK